MPASLLASQFATLEPLAADEHGVTIDVDQDIDSIVDEYISQTGRRSDDTGIAVLADAPTPDRSPPDGN